MRSLDIRFGSRPAFLAACLISAAALPAQTTRLIDITEPRPLSSAFDALEVIVGKGINYEDPPYENMADLQDVSTQKQRAGRPGYHLIVPRSGRVMAQVQEPATAAAVGSNSIFQVNQLLSSYRQNALPGDFILEQANGMLYVTPTKVLGANGAMREVTSPMTARVTIPYATRSVAEAAQAIFDEVHKATGQRIVIGTFPFWPTHLVNFGVTGEPARDALAKLFSAAGGGPFSYRLTFDPKPDAMRIFDYMINVRPTASVSPMAPLGVGTMPATPNPAVVSQQVTGDRPFRRNIKQ